jgi:hypothetical protein
MGDFRLPVWDWENIPSLPEPYRTWDCTPLLQRNCLDSYANVTDGCALQAWLLTPENNFKAFIGYESSDGNYPPQAAGGPHSAIHSLVGGFMQSPNTAAADPLFFAHHANVDRWWGVWRQRYEHVFASHPDYQKWLDTRLTFFDHLSPPPNLTSMSVRQLLYENLGYEDAPQQGSQLCLPKFDPLVSNSVTKFVQGLDRHSLDLDLNRLRSTVRGGLLPRFMGIVGSTEALRSLGPFSLPVSFQAALDPRDGPGYYTVGVKKPGTRSEPITIGGFGVFSSSDRMANASQQVAGNLCLKSEAIIELGSLFDQTGATLDFQVVYGITDMTTCPPKLPAHAKPLQLHSFEIRFPETGC